MIRETVTRSPEETRAVAADFARGLRAPALVRLFGDLGAGKTCFVQGMAEQLGWEGPVNSPTYTLIQEYDTDPPLVHADLYRLTDPEEMFELEFETLLEEERIVAVEWSERVPGFWPENAWRVELHPVEGDPEARRIVFREGNGDV